MKKTNYIWVIEVKYENGEWYPCVGVGLNREDGRRKLKDWKIHNVSEDFRLKKYIRESDYFIS